MDFKRGVVICAGAMLNRISGLAKVVQHTLDVTDLCCVEEAFAGVAYQDGAIKPAEVFITEVLVHALKEIACLSRSCSHSLVGFHRSPDQYISARHGPTRHIDPMLLSQSSSLYDHYLKGRIHELDDGRPHDVITEHDYAYDLRLIDRHCPVVCHPEMRRTLRDAFSGKRGRAYA